MSDVVTKLMQTAEAVVRDELSGGEELMPSVLVISAAGGVGLVPLPWRSAGEKRAYLASLRAMFRDTGVVAYAIWSECWIGAPQRNTGPPTDFENYQGVLPHDDPGRVDGVILVGAVKGEPPAMRTWQIERAEGRPPKLTPRMAGDEWSAHGPLGELLNG